MQPRKNRQLILPELQPTETVKLHRVQPRPPPPKKIGPALGTKALSRTHKLTIFSSLAP